MARSLAGLLYRRGHFVETVAVARRFRLVDDDAAEVQWLRKFMALYDVSLRHRSAAAADSAAGERDSRGEREVRNSVGMILLRVPGGRFERGCSACDEDARPAQSVTVPELWFGQHEVTVAQYKQFMRETGYRRSVQGDGFDQAPDDHPAFGVSWNDAHAFTVWLSAREQAVYRLPTEAEWEFAARGGVGSFARDRSAFGLFDMAGNVREWCLDEYDATYYAWSPERQPYGPVTDTGLKVLRGGAWNHPGGVGFAVARWRAAANQAYAGYGFRLVREVQ